VQSFSTSTKTEKKKKMGGEGEEKERAIGLLGRKKIPSWELRAAIQAPSLEEVGSKKAKAE